MTQGVTNPKKSGSIGKEIDWTLMVEMPNDQVTGENVSEFIKLDLMLGQPQKRAPLSSQLPKCDDVMLEIGYKKR